jgi:hypothetical protein
VTGDELKAQAIAWFGARGWQTKLSALLGIDRTALWRQIQNDAVSGPVTAAVTAWQRHGLPQDAGETPSPLLDPRPFQQVLHDWLKRHDRKVDPAMAAFLRVPMEVLVFWNIGDSEPDGRYERAVMTMVDEGRLTLD